MRTQANHNRGGRGGRVCDGPGSCGARRLSPAQRKAAGCDQQSWDGAGEASRGEGWILKLVMVTLKWIQVMGRAATELALQLLGGGHRLNPTNMHQVNFCSLTMSSSLDLLYIGPGAHGCLPLWSQHCWHSGSSCSKTPCQPWGEFLRRFVCFELVSFLTG